jgi:hypothetical protein
MAASMPLTKDFSELCVESLGAAISRLLDPNHEMKPTNHDMKPEINYFSFVGWESFSLAGSAQTSR